MLPDRELIRRGAESADVLLARCFRVGVQKLDPFREADFLRMVNTLARALGRDTQKIDQLALDRALDDLDADWPRMTARQQEVLITQVNRRLRRVGNLVVPAVDQTFRVHADRVVGDTRKAARKRFDLSIEPAFNLTDKRIMRFIWSSQGNFVRNEYGRRSNDLSRRARDIVASGLEEGLGRVEISNDLRESLGAAYEAQRVNYWQIIAAAFVNRGRSYGTLSAFQEAEIQRFQFLAVLDEVTTDICRFLHKKTFDVGAGLKTLGDSERARSAEAIKAVTPWVRTGMDEDGNQIMFYERGEKRITVGRVLESAVGQKDRKGRFSQTMSSATLSRNGLTIPPLHGFCRSTLVAV